MATMASSFSAMTIALLALLTHADANGIGDTEPIIWDPSGDGNFWCVQQDLDNQNYCGGADTDDPWAPLSCTPYAYRPNTYNILHNSPIGTCGNGSWRDDDPYLNIIANGQGYGSSTYPNVDTNAWASDFNSKNADYWVFHGCDGAGLQSDCAGDIKYIERLSYLWNDSYYGINDGEGNMPSEGVCTGWDDTYNRNYCKFVHPGTKHVYSDYHGGWWGDDCGDGRSQFGSSNMACIKEEDFSSLASGDWTGPLKDNVFNIPDAYFGGNHPFDGDGDNFSFMLFEWRCEEDSNLQHNLFSNPSIRDYGWKCFVDNEPDSQSQSSPPWVEIYFGTLTKDQDGKDVIKLYQFQSDPSGNIVWTNEWNPDTLYPVHLHDGSDVPYYLVE